MNQTTPLTVEDLKALKENSEVEFKKAAGKDGTGAVPNDFWPTYSAFANNNGGDIFLGVEEKQDKSLVMSGLSNVDKVKKELFDLLNNKNKASENLLTDLNIQEIDVGNGRSVLRIHIPRAPRRSRPIYVGLNPLSGTYTRKHEGDYLMEDRLIKKMLAEQVEDSMDARILPQFTLEDLDVDSINAYRQTFAARHPTHPFLSKDLLEFLRLIGAWNKDRETGNEGVTVAGLLMFGHLRSIMDEFPNFILDYQERDEPNALKRWVDRLTTDGTWSGNIFDFYRRVYPKLTADLKVPFRLEGGTRIDETPVHEALREALVNTIIHADYNGRVSIYVAKRPDMFGFRNPGLMRIPIEQAKQGGDSDCRNRNLQKMFQHIGASEQAGSGIPKIYQNWSQQHWRNPKTGEKRDPEQTLFELYTISLFPQEVMEQLQARFGAEFEMLPEFERIVLATTATEESVSHGRLKDLCTLHPSDISKALTNLAKNGFLITEGTGRGTLYHLAQDNTSSLDSQISSLDKSISSLDIAVTSENIENIEYIIALPAVESTRLSRSKMEDTLVHLCRLREQPLIRLAQLVNRNPEHLRNHYLKTLVKAGKLLLRHEQINHPDQAYRAASK